MDAPAVPEACTLVIFGAAGDLTKRLLIPAIYNLKREGLLPERFSILGIAHHDKSDDDFRKELIDFLTEFASGDLSSTDWDWLADRIHYVAGELEEPAFTRTSSSA